MLFRRVLLALLIVNGLCEVKGDSSDAETIKTTNDLLTSGTDLLSNIDDLITPSKAFAKISGFMGSLGPAAMAVSAILSIITMFLPQEDSPELKAIKAGFEKVNNKLDIISSKIGNLENIVELSSAKAAFVDSLTVIRSNYEALETARNLNKKEHYRFFAKQYVNTFGLATDKIYDSLVGSHGSLGFDVVNLYKVHVKCNPKLLSELCTKGMHLIIQGLDIEGAYMGYNNFSEQSKIKSERWKPKLEVLSKHCLSRIEDCENNWKTYAYQQFRDTFRTIGGDNQVFADKLVTDMVNVVPQRSWLAVVYNNAEGFGPHTFVTTTFYEVEKIWHENGYCATVVSVPKTPQLSVFYQKVLIDLIEERKKFVEGINCMTGSNWLTPLKHPQYKDNDARFIVDTIAQKYEHGLIYVVNMDYKPGVKSVGSTLYETTIKWRCSSSPFKLIIFEGENSTK